MGSALIGLVGENGQVAMQGTAIPPGLPVNGNYQIVDNITDRDTLPKVAGLLVYVRANLVTYQLRSDLTTWVIVESNIPAAVTMFLDAAGNDNNDGLTSTTAIKTSEELSSRLCTFFGQINLTGVLTINVAAGAYGVLDLSVLNPSPSFAVILQGATSVVLDTLLTVTNTVPGNPGTRGELTVATGPFVAKGRIVTTSGAVVGAVCYSNGLNNGTDTFVSAWYNNNLANNVNIAPGVGISIQANTATFTQLITRGVGTNSAFSIRNIGITKGVYNQSALSQRAGISAISTAGSMQLRNCDLAGVFSGNIGYAGCRVNGVSVFLDGWHTFNGGVAQADMTVGPGGVLDLQTQFSFDGAQLVLGPPAADIPLGAGLGPGQLFTETLEFQNGNGSLTAIELYPGGIASVGTVWGGTGSPFAVGYLQHSGSMVTTKGTIAATQLLVSTVNARITGHDLAWAGLPIGYPRAGCYFAQDPDPAAVGVTA